MSAETKPYLDFDLHVEKVGRRYRARATTPFGGVSTAEFSRPFAPDQVKLLLLRVGRTRLTSRATPGRVPVEEIGTVEAFGRRLFERVFTGDVRSALDVSLAEARRRETGLRIRLRLAAAPELADLPWEYLAVPSGGYFALSRHTPIVRYIDLAVPEPTLQVDGPLRMLVMVSNPLNSDLLDVEKEWARLVEGLQDVVTAGQLTIDRLPTASLSALRHRLERNNYHILHFVGHGGFDPAGQAGLLLLEDEFDAPMTATADDLAIILDDHASLRLAVLNSCEGSRSGTKDPFSGTAQTLVRRGLPAVVAMQFEISDVAATDFARGFYSALGAGFRVDAAVAEGRKEILAKGNRLEWGTPSLFMRSPDGQVFGVPPSPRVIEPAPVTRERLSAVAATAVGEPVSTQATVPPIITITDPGAAPSPVPPTVSPTALTEAAVRSGSAAAEARAARGKVRRHPRLVAVGLLAPVALAAAVFAATRLMGAGGFDFDPHVVDFGEMEVGMNVTLSVVVRSNGWFDLDNVFIRGPDVAAFRLEVCEDPVVNPFRSCEIKVSLAPLRTGFYSDELVVVAGSLVQSIELTGSASARSEALDPLVATPENIDFETLAPVQEADVYIEPAASPEFSSVDISTVTLTQSGNAFAITTDGCTGATLKTGQSCLIRIRHSPDDALPDSGELSIASLLTPEPLIVTLSGPGVVASPSPSPTSVRPPLSTPEPPTPTRTPEPTPTPTPEVTPEPTPPPTPPPVGTYRCLTLDGAKSRILADGFAIGTISPPGAEGSWIVQGQSPAPGTKAAPGTPINLSAQALQPCAAPP